MRRTLGVLVCLLVPLPATAGGVAILNTVLADNGDDDGFADTRETVSMRLTVQNTSGVPLTGVTLSIGTEDLLRVCPSVSTIAVGDLAQARLPGQDVLEVAPALHALAIAGPDQCAGKRLAGAVDDASRDLQRCAAEPDHDRAFVGERCASRQPTGLRRDDHIAVAPIEREAAVARALRDRCAAEHGCVGDRSVVGIDHVGIGTDFDGGGGIPGFNDASEALNVTIELVRRGYTEDEIKKIWGENLLRAWREVERVAAEMQG